ncbi:YbaK/EbsC family protein [Streptomyces sp. YGL11-2]|uniref:YbaK/EbsC family protein n=1 Tax=Streptomyces sp. YGL11-2 TaxID=3414028 RepID=UPI003CEDE973
MINSLTTPFGRFEAAWRAVERPELLAASTAATLREWQGAEPVESALVVDTDPENADTSVFCETYDVPLDASANCVIVTAKRGQEVSFAACVALATTRVDVNKTVRKHLGARKASFAPMDTAVTETGMEYGGISPLGLPAHWPVLVDEAVSASPYVLIGSGRRRGKIILPGRFLAQLPQAEVLAQLAG